MRAETPCADLRAATAHRLLADERRVALIAALDEADRPLYARELAVLLAARDQGRPPGQIDEGVLRLVLTDLRDEHLPLLAEHGAVERAGERCAPGPNLPCLVAAAEAVERHVSGERDDGGSRG